MLLNRIDVDCDLSEAGVVMALNKCYGVGQKTLVVSPNELKVGCKLAKDFKLKLQMDNELPSNAWYVYDEYFGIFSPAA